jgi:hypothetical protein
MEASIEDYATWEDFYVIKARFPKSDFLGASNFSSRGRCHGCDSMKAKA